MSPVCGDAYSKLVEVVTVADVENLKKKIFVQTLSTRFGQDFEVEA